MKIDAIADAYKPEALTQLVLTRGAMIMNRHEVMHFVPTLIELGLVEVLWYRNMHDRDHRPIIHIKIGKVSNDLRIARLPFSNFNTFTLPYMQEGNLVTVEFLYKGTRKYIMANVPKVVDKHTPNSI